MINVNKTAENLEQGIKNMMAGAKLDYEKWSYKGDGTSSYSKQQIDEWDSIGHMNLISALEENFKITFETDDIVDFSSFKKGIQILKKYKIS